MNKKNDQETWIPLGRSYDNHHWEAAAGVYNTLYYECDELSCKVTLPETIDHHHNRKFQLNTFEHNLSRRDEIARFFEQSTCKFVRENGCKESTH